MSDCCTPRGYRLLFSEKSARAALRRYRKKGLDATSRRVVDLLLQWGVEGRTVLEVGGGIGALQVELLRAGASRAVSVELTPTYEAAARELLQAAGFSDRVERKLLDLVEAGPRVDAADIVVLNRVICCYPDMPRLAAAAAERTDRLIVMSFPREKWWTRLGVAAGNLAFRLARREFHVFVHPPEAIRRTVARLGPVLVADREAGFWEVAAWERARPA